MNSLKICTSASLEAHVNAAAFTQAMLVAGEGDTEVSGTGVTGSNGAVTLRATPELRPMRPHDPSSF